MTNSQIENSAVGSVKRALNDTGYIDVSNIKEGDKFPVWDGDILVYDSDKERKNENIKYKLPVQVKGTEARVENSLKFKIRTNDLKKYRDDGGVIYFVVQVDKNNSINNKIFYIDLLPVNIKKILKNKTSKGSISVDIKIFPEKKEELVNLIFNFGLNKEKQASFIPTDKYTLADFDKIYLHYETPFKITPNNILLNFSGFLYGYKDDIPYPILEIQKGGISQIITVPLKISVNNTVFFENCELKKDINSLTLIINHNIEFIYNNNDRNIKCNLLLKGTLDNYIKSIKFLLEIHKVKHFYINESKQDCPFESDDTKILEDNLRDYEILKEAFDKSGVTEDIELRVFNETDKRNASILINAFVHNQDIALKKDSEGYVLDFHILEKTITCLAVRNKTGKYNLLRFPIEGTVTVEKNDNLIKVPPVLMLKRQHFKNSANINFMTFVGDIKKYEVTASYLEVVNESVLELVSAYDETKKDILLDVAYNIVQWMEQVNTEDKSAIIYHLNLLQCKVRKDKKLPDEDKEYLYKISEQSDEVAFRFGATVLLKEKDRAERYFKQLPKEEQERIINCPIYTLWKGTNNG